MRKETLEDANNRIEAAARFFEDDKEPISFTMDEFDELSATLPKFK